MATTQCANTLIQRQARLADAPTAVTLLHATMPWLDDLLQCPPETTRRLIAALFRQEHNRWTYAKTQLLCTADDQPVGLLMVLPGKSLRHMTWPTLRRAFFALPPRHWFNLLRAARHMITLREAEADELYISHLAVHPNHRRQGIGQQLLQWAVQQAHDQGLTRLSLLCECDNLAARQLYEKHHFTMMQTTRAGHARFYRMVKELGETIT